MTDEDFNPRLQAAYLEIVDNQLRANTPPETRQTYERLKGLGYNNRDAKLLVASAIAAETYYIMKENRPFNNERFVRNLNRLPNQSFDEK
jgi:nucleoside diphosphate kinase